MTTANERVASLREEYARLGEDVSGLSDLELLNRQLERADRDRIDTNDRYMRLLIEQRKYGDRVRAATVAEVRERLDVLACQAVGGKAAELTRLLGTVDALPESANAQRVARLKHIAAETRRMIRLLDELQAERSGQVWRLDDNHALVNGARRVLGVLRNKPGVSADDVIRLVGEAVTPNGNLRDLFDVANATPIKRQLPAFADGGWTEMGGGNYWTFEPDSSRYRVVAYNQGDTWWIDLQGPTGALIAAGETGENEVAATAQLLVDQAASLAASGLRPWQCWRRVTAGTTAEVAA